MKAFTLIELLAVIIILAIITLIATPIILDVIDEAEKSADMSQANLLLTGAEYLYTTSILDDKDMKDFNGSTNLYGEIITNGEMPPNGKAFITPDGKIAISVYINGLCYEKTADEEKMMAHEVETPEDCAPKVEEVIIPEEKYLCNNGKMRNLPIKLTDGLIPVEIASDGVVTKADNEWYNYCEQEWANAVMINNEIDRDAYKNAASGEIIDTNNIAAYYVWIPRYEYQLFDTDYDTDLGEEKLINIRLVDVEVKNELKEEPKIDDWYTHPAFSINDGNNVTEISGFWVGKYELTGTITNPTTLPNIASLRNNNISSFFTAISNMDELYGLTNSDSHLIKNNEWGAVAYLSHSSYGKGTSINENNTAFITGAGDYIANTNQSTTGNISGVYDMAGGSWEYAMGNMSNNNGLFVIGNSGFSVVPDLKYYDSYSYGAHYMELHRGKYGHAIFETANWYNDYVGMPFGNAPSYWVVRGGLYHHGQTAGIFNISTYPGQSGNDFSTRTTMWVN